MLMALGLFVFERTSVAFDETQRRAEWKHASADRVGARPAYQFVGPGEETYTFSGSCIPEYGNRADALEQLREMAGTGEALPLIEGTGRVLGNYVITAVDERGRAHIDTGVPRVTDFGIDLLRVS